MQGIYLNIDGKISRPSSKKAVKEVMAVDAHMVGIEATSLFGGEYDGPADEMPNGTKIYFAGPDPYTNRKFYGTIEKSEKGYKVT